MSTSPIPKAVKDCEVPKCFNASSCFLKFGFLVVPGFDSENALLDYLALVSYLIHSVPCLLCLQKDCLLEQVVFIFSQNTA